MNTRSLLLIALLLVGGLFPAYGNSIDGVRVWPAPENTRIVFDSVSYTHLTLPTN